LKGYVFGFLSQKNPEIFFLWQIGVLKDYRGTGLAGKLVKALLDRALVMGAERMHVTAEIGNIPSWKMFQKYGFRNISSGETVTRFGQAAMVDYYGSGTDQVFLEKIIQR